MILVDANLLIYAVNTNAHQHDAARYWLEEVLSGTTVVGLPWPVILAFLRVTTHRQIFQTPLSSMHAVAYVESWLQQPYVVNVVPGEKHWMILKSLLQSSGTAGNLCSDAHLAAMALEQHCPVYSADNDFKRFKGVEHINPLEVMRVHEESRAY